MKLVFMMYLEDDRAVMEKLLAASDVGSYSRLPLEGHGEGVGGWYGEIAPFRSEVIFALLPEGHANRLIDTVSRCEGCQDPHHPIHAGLMDLERAVQSGLPVTPSSE
jgi:hypothetical protein